MYKIRTHIKENKRAFTLAELLIVLAIITILVAISIPIFLAKKEKVKIAVDAANIRNARVYVISKCMMEDNYNTDRTFFYDADKGIIKQENEDIIAYGQAKKEHDNASGIPKGNILKLIISPDLKINSISWVETKSGDTGDNIECAIQDLLDDVKCEDWKDIQGKGITLKPGTVLRDGDNTVVFSSYPTWYEASDTKLSLEEFSDKFSEHLIEINDQTKILSQEECLKELPGHNCKKGTIAHYKDDYYILKENTSFVLEYKLDDIITGGRWSKISKTK